MTWTSCLKQEKIYSVKLILCTKAYEYSIYGDKMSQSDVNVATAPSAAAEKYLNIKSTSQ